MSDPSVPPVIGVLGGSGVYQIDGLDNVRWERVHSPFGEPSDELCFGELEGQQMIFLPRHGRGHRVPPSELNYRANIDALKRSGRHRDHLGQRRRQPEGRARSRHLRNRRSVRRPHLRAGEVILRHRHGRPRLPGRPCLPAARRPRRGSRGRSRISAVRGGTYLAMEGRSSPPAPNPTSTGPGGLTSSA